MRKLTITLLALALAVPACSTSKDDNAAATTTSATAPADTVAETTVPAPTDTTADTVAETAAPSTDAPVVTFPPVVDDRAPGVSDTSIKVGVMYLDLSAAGPILGINHGDYMAAYNAAFAEVNDAGGINGRMLEPVYTPIVPASADQGTAACTALTDDDSVFVVLGNYVDTNAPCVVTTHETPLLGAGDAMTDEALAASKALWYSVGGGSSAANAGLQALVDQGLLTGKVGVVGALGLEMLYENGPKQILEDGGVNVADVAYLDIINGAGDPNALFAAAETIALKFQSEGIDQVIFNTGAGRVFPNGLARTDYRPQMLYDNLSDAALYFAGEGSDLSVMEKSIAVGPYDSPNLFPTMGGATAKCMASQQARLGVTILPSGQVPKGDPDYWTSSAAACQLIGLLTTLLEAAGPELNWGTFTSAGWNIGDVELAGGLDPFFFDKDHPNGSPRLYTYNWDPASQTMIADAG